MDNRTRNLQLLDAYGITQAKSAEQVAAVTHRVTIGHFVLATYACGGSPDMTQIDGVVLWNEKAKKFELVDKSKPFLVEMD